MSISDLSTCFITLHALHLYRFVAAWDWETFKSNSIYINPDAFIQANAILNTPQGKDDERNLTGFDFNNKEIARLKLWPEGTIPFYIDKVSYDKVFRDNLRLLLENINNICKVRFIELPKPPNDQKTRWIFFINRRGVLNTDDYTTKNFTNVGIQKVVLGYDCLKNGELFKVVLAIVGVPPQHNAPNRDQYIIVKKENIVPEKLHMFDILSDKEWLFHDLEYDFQSAGHFDFHKYTQNGFATIEPKSANKSAVANVGQEKKLSRLDVLKIRMLYHFIAHTNSKQTSKWRIKNTLKSRSKDKLGTKDKLKSKSKPRKNPKKYFGLPKNVENNTQSNNTYRKINNNKTLELKHTTDNNIQINQVKTVETVKKNVNRTKNTKVENIEKVKNTEKDLTYKDAKVENIEKVGNAEKDQTNKKDNVTTIVTEVENVTISPYKLVKLTKKILKRHAF